MWYFFHVDALSGFWKWSKDRKWIISIIHEKEKDFKEGDEGEVDDVMLHHMY